MHAAYSPRRDTGETASVEFLERSPRVGNQRQGGMLKGINLGHVDIDEPNFGF